MFMRRKVLFAAVLVLAILAGFCFLTVPALADGNSAAQGDKEAKYKAIEELLYVMNADNLMQRVMDQVSNVVANEYSDPNENKEFIDEFKSKFNTKEVIQLVAAIYDKYYTYDEIKQLIKFYKSPIGQKVLLVAPDVVSESMKVGAEYAKKIIKEMDSYKKLETKSNLTACECNLKNIATALEMYSTDNNGYYPPELKNVSPDYLQKLPQCPVSGKNYVYELSKKKDSFIIYCPGESHKDSGITGPAYGNNSGLKKNIKDAK